MRCRLYRHTGVQTSAISDGFSKLYVKKHYVSDDILGHCVQVIIMDMYTGMKFLSKTVQISNSVVKFNESGKA